MQHQRSGRKSRRLMGGRKQEEEGQEAEGRRERGEGEVEEGGV